MEDCEAIESSLQRKIIYTLLLFEPDATTTGISVLIYFTAPDTMWGHL